MDCIDFFVLSFVLSLILSVVCVLLCGIMKCHENVLMCMWELGFLLFILVAAAAAEQK